MPSAISRTARECDERIGRHHGGDALKEVEKVDLRHGQAVPFAAAPAGAAAGRPWRLARVGAAFLLPDDEENVLMIQAVSNEITAANA